MINLLIIFVLLGVVGAAVFYVVKAKKKGVKCIGCPGGCSGNCEGGCGHCPPVE